MAVETNARLNFVAADKSKRAFSSLNKSLKNTARTLQVVQGPLGPLAGRFTAFSGALGALSPVTLGTTAALTGLGLVLTKSVKRAADFNSQIGTLSAVLKSTGGAAGLSAKEIDDFAVALGKATLTSREEVLKAATSLATFGSISEGVFTKTLGLAQDASQAFGQDLKTTILQFGKALEDPITGLTSLRRIGVSFSKSQTEMIKSLVESGKQLEAQRLILAGIEKQVGGAGAGAAKGTLGALDTLGEEFGQLAVEIGKSVLKIELFQSAIKNIGKGVGVFRRWLFGAGTTEELDKEIADVFDQLIKAQDRLDKRIKQGSRGRDLAASQKRVAGLKARLKALTNERQAIAATATEADRKAAAIKRVTAEQAASAKAEEKRKEVEKQLAKLQDKLFPKQAIVKQYQKDLKLLVDEYGAGSEQVRRLQEQLAKSLGGPNKIKGLKKAKDEVMELSSAATEIGDAFGDAFTDATLNAKKFGDVINNLGKQIASSLVQQAIVGPLVGAISGGLGNAIPGFFKQPATPGTGAIGGSRSGLTLVGERGPEMVNLPRGSRITPNNRIGGTSVIINNSALPAEQVQTTEQPDGSIVIDLVRNIVNDELNNNGGGVRNFQGAFNLRRRGVTR